CRALCLVQRTRPASQRCAYGRVFHVLSPNLPRIPFKKPPLSLDEQLRLLRSRGLTVKDAGAATHYLTHIGYYRLSGYALPFQIGHAPADSRRRDTHIEHYYQTYSKPDMPPSWMVFESVTFGAISFAYKNLIPREIASVCTSYGLPHPVLASWLHSLNYIRNIC